MAETLYRSQIIPGQGSIPEVQTSTGNIENLKIAGKAFKNISDDMRNKSMNLFLMDLETNIRESLNIIYERNKDNPDALSKEIGEYQKGVQDGLPYSVLPQVKQRFMAISSPLVSQATVNRNKILDEQLGVSVLNNQNQILLDINNNAQNLIDVHPDRTDDEKKLLATQSFNSVATSFDSLRNTLDIRRADGTPFFNAAQKIKILDNAQHYMLKSAALGWLSKTPNKLQAYQDWINGKVNITTVDDKNNVVQVNVRNSFSPDLVAKIDRDIVKAIRDDLWIQSKLRKEEEAFIKVRGDEISKRLEQRAQDGVLSIEEVERLRGSISFRQYKDFREKAKSSQGITNGEVYSDLAIRAIEGENIEEEVKDGMYRTKEISYKSGLELLRMNSVSPTGFKPPVVEGREYLIGQLGINTLIAQKKDTKMASSANFQYNTDIEKFRNEHGREPNREEVRVIADRIIPLFSLAEDRDAVQSLELPKFADLSFKRSPRNLTVKTVNELEAETTRYYMNKHNGNKELTEQDDEYKHQMKIIENYRNIAVDNEKRRASRK